MSTFQSLSPSVSSSRMVDRAVSILFWSLTVAISLATITVCPGSQSTPPGVCRATGQDVSETLIVESGEVEPAVPLNVVVKVRVLASEPLIEITVVLGKRAGFPAAMFFDRDVTARVVLPAGLELHRGALSWNGELRGDQVVELVATVKAILDLHAVVDVAA